MEVRIWLWNINSIRNKIPMVVELLKKHNIDILLINETKIQPKHEKDIILPNDYKIIFNSNQKSSYHGVAIIYKKEIEVASLSSILEAQDFLKRPRVNNLNLKNTKKISSVSTETLQKDIAKGHVTEGRILTVKCSLPLKGINSQGINSQETKQSFILVATYCPNSGCDRKEPLKRLAYRTCCWDKDLYAHLKKLEEEYGRVIWLGDLNVARRNNDMFKMGINIAGTTPEERNNFELFLNENKWIDSWEICNTDKNKIEDRCTYGVNSFCKLRIDYILTSPTLKNNIKSSTIDQEYEGSDHAPLGTTFLF